MHNETASIAVDLNFGDSWFTDRNFKTQSFSIDELDDVWEDQESSEFFELVEYFIFFVLIMFIRAFLNQTQLIEALL